MKKFLLLFLCVSAAAQTINTNQIRPSTNNGYSLQTIGGQTVSPISGGGVNPGTLNCPLGFYPTAAALISPTGLLTDCATKTASYLRSSNVINGALPSGFSQPIYPYQFPITQQYQQSNMFSLNDFVGINMQQLNINNTTSFALDSGIENGPDFTANWLYVNVNSPIQGGGTHVLQLTQNGNGGDAIPQTTIVQYNGCTEGFHECAEPLREFVGPRMYDPNGTVTLNGIDTWGREKMQVSGLNTTYMGTQTPVIDSSKIQSPKGNIAYLSTSSDYRFIEMTPDTTLQASLNMVLGNSSGQTTIVAGADLRKYDGNCPSTVVSNSWGDTTVNGQTVQINPYAQDHTGQHSPYPLVSSGARLTAAQCVTVGSTSGMSKGIPIGIWGAHDNKEITKITTVVDSTHIVVPLNKPHDAGEYVTWGAGLGYAVSTPAGDIPAHTFNSLATLQYSDVHTVFPIMRWDGTNLWVWPADEAVAGAGELRLQIFSTNTPQIAGVYTPSVSGGVVTAISSNANSYSANGGAITAFFKLPPPTVTFGGGGCTTNPTLHFTTTNGFDYKAVLDSGGSGCSSGLTITPQSAYANPITLFPMTFSEFIQDPTTGSDHSGYLMTDVLAASSQWANGDTVEETPNTAQYLTGNEQYMSSPFTMRSQRFGPTRTIGFGWNQTGPSEGPTEFWEFASQPLSKFFWGDASTNYGPSSDPAKAYYARFTPPVLFGLGGNYSSFLNLHTPPYSGPFGNAGGGILFHVLNCVVAGQEAGSNPPCTWGVWPNYKLFYDDHNGNYISINQGSGIDIGPNLTVAGNSVCLSNGANCAAPSSGYAIRFRADPYNYPLNIGYFFGETSAISDNEMTNPVYYQWPTACVIKQITASAMAQLGQNGSASADSPQFLLYDATQSTAIWTANWKNWAGTAQHTIINSNVGFSIAEGDQVYVRVFAPNWTTPPGNFDVSATVYCQ